MADQQNPWDGLGNDVQVVDSPPSDQPPAPAAAAPSPAPAAAPSPAPAAAPSATEPKPWDGLDNVQVVAPPPTDAEHQNAVAGAADEALTKMQELKWQAPDTNTWTGWLGEVGRAASFGLSDPLVALSLQRQFKDQAPDLTFADALKAVRDGYDKQPSLSADIVGSLAPGTLAVKGTALLGKGAMTAATRAGVVDGAVRWAARNPRLARFLGGASGGAATGATYEAVRSSIDQTLGAAAGDNFDPETIKNATIQGAVVGGLLTPVADASMAGVKGVYGWVRNAITGNDPAAAAKATQQIVGVVKRAGEDPNMAIERLRNDVTTFTQDHGYIPALAEVLPPEQTRSLSRVISSYTGLDERARGLVEDQFAHARAAFDEAVRSGTRLKDSEVLDNQVENLFTDVVERHGATPVKVADDALTVLDNNREWLNGQARNNPAAREIQGVLEAKDSLVSLRDRARRLIGKKNVSDAQTEVATLNEGLQRLIYARTNGGSVSPSELASLRALINLKDSIARRMDKVLGGENATFDLQKFMPELQQAEKIMSDYESNGLMVKLSDANHLRSAASRAAHREPDLAKQDSARAVRDAITKVGVDEVPLYGKVVKLWSNAKTRAEAQATGKAAVDGGVSTANLETRVGGRAPGGRLKGERIAANAKGIEEGGRIAISRGLQGTQAEAVGVAKRIVESDEIKKNIHVAMPALADKVISAATQFAKSTAGLAMVGARRSPSQIEADTAAARDLIVSGVFDTLGGAGRANALVRVFMKATISRGTATKLVDMLADPKQVDQALRYITHKGVSPTALVLGAVGANLGSSKVE